MSRAHLKISSRPALEVELKPTIFHFLWATWLGFPFLILLFALSAYVGPPAGVFGLVVCVPVLMLQWREFRFLRDGGERLEIEAGRFHFRRIEPHGNLLRFWRPLTEVNESVELVEIDGFEFGRSKRGESNVLFVLVEPDTKILASRMTRVLNSADRDRLSETLERAIGPSES